MKKHAVKVAASLLCLGFYLFMAVGSDESSSTDETPSAPVEEEPVIKEEKPAEEKPVFSNDAIEEETDTTLMRDSYDNEILEE